MLSHFSRVQVFMALWTVAWQGPVSRERILDWVTISFLTQGSNPCLLHLLHRQADSLPAEPLGKPKCYIVVVVQLLSHVWLYLTPWTATCQASLSFAISRSLLKLRPIESMMPDNHLILCRPLLLHYATLINDSNFYSFFMSQLKLYLFFESGHLRYPPFIFPLLLVQLSFWALTTLYGDSHDCTTQTLLTSSLGCFLIPTSLLDDFNPSPPTPFWWSISQFIK